MPDDRTQKLFAAGMAAYRQGEFASAAAAWEELLTLAPDHANALQLLGVIHFQQKRWVESERYFRRAWELNADSAQCWFNLAKVVACQGRWTEAEQLDREGLRRQPDDARGWDHLGTCLRETGRPAEAESAHRRAIELDPKEAGDALNHLGIALVFLGRTSEAAAAFAASTERSPQSAEAYANLGNALREMMRSEEAHAAFERAVELRPEYALGWTGLLLNAQYLTTLAPAEKFDLHRRYAAAVRDELARARIEIVPPPRLVRARPRIGYVSSELFQHAVTHFLRPILSHHDRTRFEVSVFSNTHVADAVTAELRSKVDHWHSLFGVRDDDALALIREAGIDLLVDLNGHSGFSRLGLFARRAAPVQVTYLGYPDTTGLREIDYRLTDEIADPPGAADAWNAETLWRLLAPAWCYQPPADAPAPRAGASTSGSVTFGCFNNSAKINRPLVSWWADILMSVPGSRLLLKARTFSDPAVRSQLLGWFADSGVAVERIELKPWRATPAQHFAEYLPVDIALDSFPYNGTTTTCDALWMGVPVVTLAGREHRSRVGASLLTSVGLGELIADSPSAYVAAAIALAHDDVRRAKLRGELRERVRRSPLLDGPGFTRKLEQAYLGMLAVDSPRRGATAAKVGGGNQS